MPGIHVVKAVSKTNAQLSFGLQPSGSREWSLAAHKNTVTELLEIKYM